MSDTLTTKQRAAVEALVTFGEIGLAADAVGVDRATVRRWRSSPKFAAALKAAEAAALDDLSRRLTGLAASALDVLTDMLADDQLAPALRLRAADIAIARMLQVRELVEVEERLAALEAAVAGEARVA